MTDDTLRPFTARIAVGPDRENHYSAVFWAEDIDHAQDQAQDFVRNNEVEWVVAVFPGDPTDQ